MCILSTRTNTFLNFMRMLSKGWSRIQWTLQKINQKVTDASYAVALEIAKQKKKHIHLEKLWSCSLKMVEIVLEKGMEKKLFKQYYSKEDKWHIHWQQRTSCTWDQVYSIWHFNSTWWIDWCGSSQLMVFARYVSLVHLKRNFSFVLL